MKKDNAVSKTTLKSPKGSKLSKKVELHSINRSRYFEQAVDQIRELIDNGYLNVGDKLPIESELSEQLNIGRSSIREALRVLEADGLIEVRQGSGTFILPRSEWVSSRMDPVGWLRQRGESLIQLLQVREWIEGLSVSLVADNPTPQLIRELEKILEEMAILVDNARNNEIEPDLDRIADLNTSFHLSISAHCGNQFVHEFLSMILPSFSESNKAVLFTKRRLDLQAVEHSNLFEAIKAHDPDRAVRYIRGHISRVRAEIQDLSNGS